MVMHLVRRNAKSVPWITEETLVLVIWQSSIDHVVGPRMSKSSSPSEVPDSRILRGYCGAKRSGCPGPFRIISPKARNVMSSANKMKGAEEYITREISRRGGRQFERRQTALVV